MLFSSLAYSQNNEDSLSVEQHFENARHIRKKSISCFAFSTIPIAIGGVQFINGNLVSGLFFMTAGVIIQITGIVIDMDANIERNKGNKKKAKK
jgi:uncharacterized membrane protein